MFEWKILERGDRRQNARNLYNEYIKDLYRINAAFKKWVNGQTPCNQLRGGHVISILFIKKILTSKKWLTAYQNHIVNKIKEFKHDCFTKFASISQDSRWIQRIRDAWNAEVFDGDQCKDSSRGAKVHSQERHETVTGNAPGINAESNTQAEQRDLRGREIPGDFARQGAEEDKEAPRIKTLFSENPGLKDEILRRRAESDRRAEQHKRKAEQHKRNAERILREYAEEFPEDCYFEDEPLSLALNPGGS